MPGDAEAPLGGADERNAGERSGEMARRLFVAVTFDEGAREELVRTQRLLLPRLRKARPTRRDNLHLTLAFLGELDARQEAASTLAMREAVRDFALSGGELFEVFLGPLGSFGRRGGARIVWRGVAGGDGDATGRERRGYCSLVSLQSSLDGRLRAHGLALEERLYLPHVTLARGARAAAVGKGHGGSAEAAAEMAELLSRMSEDIGIWGPVGVDAVSLMWSHRPDGGELAYTEVCRVDIPVTRRADRGSRWRTRDGDVAGCE